MSQIIKVSELLKTSWGNYRRNAKLLAAIALVVALPGGLLTLAGVDPVISAYISLATVLMNLALIWTIDQLRQGHSVTVKRAYYEGTATVVQFMLTSVFLLLLLLPLALGGLLFNSAAGGASSASIGTPERLLVAILWLILAVPSLFWLVRRLFALLIVVEDKTTPLAAIRRSRELVKGRSWPVFGRLAALAAVVVVVILIPTVLLIVAASATILNFGLAALQLAVSLTVLPWSYIYLHKLYRSLL